MDCGILCVGTEILWGNTINTNATYLSKELNKLGFNVFYHLVCGDNPKRLEELLKDLLTKVDLVICTGGLGPTEDDLTKETITKTLGAEMKLDNVALDQIKGFFQRINKEMTENNIKQAYLPDGCVPFYNTRGTAPGFAIKKSDKIIVSLPGPPGEMSEMWEKSAKDYLKNFSDEKFYYKNVRLFGIGESQLETQLLPLIHGQTDPTFATYAHNGQCTLRVASKSKNIEEAKEKVENALVKVRSLVGEYIISEEDQNIEEVVCNLLIKNNLKISACESCTGGMFAERLTAYPGISKVLEKSFVTYSDKAKNEILGVKTDTLNKYTAVSEEVAVEMVKGLYNITKSDVCISVTGLAGPGGGTEDIPVGTVFMALCYKGKVYPIKKLFKDNGREYIRERAVAQMFDLIYKNICN